MNEKTEKKTLLIRSVPVEWSRRINSEAKLRGMTLSQFLVEILKQFFKEKKS